MLIVEYLIKYEILCNKLLLVAILLIMQLALMPLK